MPASFGFDCVTVPSIPEVLNLRSTSGPQPSAWWAEKEDYILFVNDMNALTLAIFHGKIFSGGPLPRGQICKWSSSFKRLRTVNCSILNDLTFKHIVIVIIISILLWRHLKAQRYN